MDLSDLKIFEAIARLGSMNQAAEAVHTVQSNVTARIRALEDEIGVPLLLRSPKGATLTPAGTRLLPYARRLISLDAEARRAARDDGTPSGALVIGTLETTAALRIAPHVADFVAAYPSVDLTLRTGTSAELIEQVLNHQLDGAFVCGPIDHPGLTGDIVFRERLVLLSAPHISSLADALAGDDVRIIVLRIGCSYRLILEALLARRGTVNVRVMEFGTLESIMSCVSAGLGVTLLPKGLIGSVWRDGQVALHDLPHDDGLVDTAFIRRRGSDTSSALAAFLAAVRPGLARAEAAE
jgi:DNA-binding transcriptional LysR family regulator